MCVHVRVSVQERGCRCYSELHCTSVLPPQSFCACIFYLPQCLNFKTTTPGVLQCDIGALTTVVLGVSTLVVKSQEGNFLTGHDRECICPWSLALFLTHS